MTIRPRSPDSERAPQEIFKNCHQNLYDEDQEVRSLKVSRIDQAAQQTLASYQETLYLSPLENRILSSLDLESHALSLEQIKHIPLSKWIQAIYLKPQQSMLYCNAARRLFKDSTITQNTQHTFSQEKLFKKATELDPLNLSSAYYRFISITLEHMETADLASQKHYMNRQMVNPDLSLNQVYAISKELWILAIQERPQEAMLYLHLARRIELGETVQLTNHQKMTWYELYQESIRLDSHHIQSYLYFAKAVRQYREKYPFVQVDNLNVTTLYLKVIARDSMQYEACIGLADCFKNNIFNCLKLEEQEALHHALVSAEELCLNVMTHHPLYSDAYRCLADQCREHPSLLIKYPHLNIKELCLKALQLDPDNIQGYITLYEGWNEITQEEEIELLDGKRYQREDLLLTATTLSPNDPELHGFYERGDILQDDCFTSFLEKFSLISLPSSTKLFIYQSLFTSILHEEEDQRVKLFKKIMNKARQEFSLHQQKDTLDQELIQEAIQVYDKIKLEHLTPDASIKTLSPEAWHTIIHTPMQKKRAYPYFAWILTHDMYKRLKALGDFWNESFHIHQRMISLWAHLLCFYPEESYTLFAFHMHTHHRFWGYDGDLFTDKSQPLSFSFSELSEILYENHLQIPFSKIFKLLENAQITPLYLNPFFVEEDLSLKKIYEISKEEWIKAIEAYPTKGILYCHLARLLEEGETVKLYHLITLSARHLYLRALQLEPLSASIHFYCAKWVANKHSSPPQKAKELYIKAITLNPLYFSAYIGLADLLDMDETVSIPGHNLIQRDALCFEVINRKHDESEAYRCLADLMRKQPSLLEKYPELNCKELYLKAIDLDACNIQAYLSLYEAWNALQKIPLHPLQITLMNGERLQKEELILKAVMINPYDPLLQKMYGKACFLNDSSFVSFLEKLSNSSSPSLAKLKIYEQIFTHLMTQDFIQEGVHQKIKVLMTAILQEQNRYKKIDLNEEGYYKRAEEISKIEELLFKSSWQGLSYLDQFRELSQEAWYDMTYPHLYWNESHYYFFIAERMCQDHSFHQNSTPIEHKKMASLLAKMICNYPQDSEVYHNLEKVLQDRVHFHFIFPQCPPEELKQITLFMHFINLDLNPNDSKAYQGIYNLASIPGIPIKSRRYDDMCSPVLLPKEYQPLSQGYAITLMNGSSLSIANFLIKVFISHSSYYNDIIHEDVLYDLSYDQLYAKDALLSKSYQFDILLWKNLLINTTRISLSDLRDNPHYSELLKNKIHVILLRLRRTYQQFVNLKKQSALSLLFPQQEKISESVTPMMNPDIPLKNLLAISLKEWSLASDLYSKNSYFYYNLARYLQHQDVEKMDKDNLEIYLTIIEKNSLQQRFLRDSKLEAVFHGYFRALELDPSNGYVYPALARVCVELFPFDLKIIAPLIQAFYLLAIDLDPENASNYLELIPFNAEDGYALIDKDPLSDQDLFLQALVLNISLPSFSYELHVMTDRRVENQNILYNKILYSYQLGVENVSHETLKTRMIHVTHQLRIQFPKSTLYFGLIDPLHPYLCYECQKAEFILPIYPLDFLTGRFALIKGEDAPFESHQLSNWMYKENFPSYRHAIGLDLVEHSSLPRHIKMKIYQNVSHVFTQLEKFYGEDFLGYMVNYEKEGVEDNFTTFKPWLRDKLHSQLRMHESLTPYFNDKDILSLIPLENTHQDCFKEKKFEQFISRIIREFDSNLSLYEEEISLDEEDLSPSSDKGALTLKQSEITRLKNDLESTRNTYIKALEIYINHPKIWMSHRRDLIAILYTKISDLLEPEEAIKMVVSSHMTHLYIISHPADLENEDQSFFLTKKELYFEALRQHVFSQEALEGIKALFTPSLEIETDIFPTKQDLHLKVLKELEVPIDFEKEITNDYYRDHFVIPMLEKDYQVNRSKGLTRHLFSSIQAFYLKVIDQQSNAPYPYYLLAKELVEGSQIQLLNGIWLSQKQLYRRSIQLGIREPCAYYRLGNMLTKKEGICFFYNKKIFSKFDLLITAFMLNPNSHFYLKELIWNLKKAGIKPLPGQIEVHYTSNNRDKWEEDNFLSNRANFALDDNMKENEGYFSSHYSPDQNTLHS
ncbi:MAG: hypothetical protein QRY71_04925 [Candidatus Rhabdochlamydia sp.]